jgi:hypothetical protein
MLRRAKRRMCDWLCEVSRTEEEAHLAWVGMVLSLCGVEPTRVGCVAGSEGWV